MSSSAPYQAPERGTLRYQVEVSLQKIVDDGAMPPGKLEEIKRRMWEEGILPDLRRELAEIFRSDAQVVRTARADLNVRRKETDRQLAEEQGVVAANSNEPAEIVENAIDDMNLGYQGAVASITSEASPDSLQNLFAEAAHHHDQTAHRMLLEQTMNPDESKKQ